MRSILLALALVAPSAAFAATPAADYTAPIATIHDAAKPQQVLLTFRTSSVQQRFLQVGDRTFAMQVGQTISVAAPVGTVVRVYSNQNSKINGQQLLQVSAADAQRTIAVR